MTASSWSPRFGACAGGTTCGSWCPGFRRPALAVSNDLFNAHTGLCLVCPVTSTRRDYPFHVEIPQGAGVEGFVMVEQVKSVDFRSRRARRIGRAPDSLLDEALSLLDACLY